MKQLTYLRTWCTHCKDFTIHYTEGDRTCLQCDTKFEPYLIGDIPEDKLKTQRNRYVRSLFNELQSISAGIDHDYPVIESDAGLSKERELQSRIRQELTDKRKEEVHQYRDNYRGTNRNSPCPCGSGLKYKNCHQIYYSSLRIH